MHNYVLCWLFVEEILEYVKAMCIGDSGTSSIKHLWNKNRWKRAQEEKHLSYGSLNVSIRDILKLYKSDFFLFNLSMTICSPRYYLYS